MIEWEEDARKKDQGPDLIGALGMNDECTWEKINAGGCRRSGMSHRLRRASYHHRHRVNRRRNYRVERCRNYRVERYCLEVRSASAHCAGRGWAERRDSRQLVHLDKDRAKRPDSLHVSHSDIRRAVARWVYSC
jgi:hypothetical protein